jgi:hypothetical protein
MDELDAEEDKLNPSREDDDEVDRLEWEYDRRRMDEMEKDIIKDFGGYVTESEEDSDEDEKEDEDDDEIREIFKAREKGCGKA